MTAKGVILPSGKGETFKPLTYQMPVGLLPIVNKPLMEHQVELLVRNQVRNIRLSCNHLSNKVEQHFATGSRWGARISYNFEQPPFGTIASLHNMKYFFQGDTLVVMDSDVIADIDLQEILKFHREKRADATFVTYMSPDTTSGLTVALNEQNRIQAVGVHRGSSPPRHYMDTGICIVEPELLDLLTDSFGNSILQACWLASQRVRLNLYGYCTNGPLVRLDNWKMYSRVQRDILEGKFQGLHIPGIEAEPGVWIGKNVSVSGKMSFDGPVLIGDNCKIGKGVTVGKGTVIGHDVLVDSDANMGGSIVLPRTFIGAQTVIRDSIVIGKLLIDANNGSVHPIGDSLAVSEIQRSRYGSKLYHFLNRLGAITLCSLLSPFALLLFAILIISMKFPLIARVRRLGPDLHELAAGNLRLRVFNSFYLGPFDSTRRSIGYNTEPITILPRLISRLGNLMNVARGDILFVGNRPLDPEYAFSITEEWRRTRFKCQSGFLSVLNTINAEEMPEDEQIIAEGFYAVNRTLGTDIGILMKTTRRLLNRMLGRPFTTKRSRPELSQRPTILE
jgi:NDP-sugar pyrophosphorylase family protein